MTIKYKPNHKKLESTITFDTQDEMALFWEYFANFLEKEYNQLLMDDLK